MVVGASTSSFDKRLVADFSNYSQVNVDIFAPGDDLNVAIPNNQYKIDGGTSLSTALVTGIAALIKSYYPHLTALPNQRNLDGFGNCYRFGCRNHGCQWSTPISPFCFAFQIG
jgi:cell wall-associated protease